LEANLSEGGGEEERDGKKSEEVLNSLVFVKGVFFVSSKN
jgi:hypothetical protein